MYRDLRDQNSVFDSLIASDLQNVGVQWNNKPDLVGCELASGNYFQALGLQPAMGRLFASRRRCAQQQPGGGAQLQLLEAAVRLRSAA